MVQEQENEEENSEFERKRRIAKAKGEPYDATDEWLSNENNKKGKVSFDNSIIVEGEKYIVDGANVIQDHDETEKAVANMIAKKSGKTVSLLPRVINTANVQSADYLIDGAKWDLKTVKGNSKNVIYNNIHKKKKQAENFIVNIEKNGMALDEATSQVLNGVFASKHTSFVKRIMIVDGKNILKVFEK